MKGHVYTTGGGRDGTCDHGLSARSLRVKETLITRVELMTERNSDDQEQWGEEKYRGRAG